jgi:hypothetical protein
VAPLFAGVLRSLSQSVLALVEKFLSYRRAPEPWALRDSTGKVFMQAGVSDVIGDIATSVASAASLAGFVVCGYRVFCPRWVLGAVYVPRACGR